MLRITGGIVEVVDVRVEEVEVDLTVDVTRVSLEDSVVVGVGPLTQRLQHQQDPHVPSPFVSLYSKPFTNGLVAHHCEFSPVLYA